MDLVILAAGLGSRFGGDKQIEPVDADGNFILDYSVFDAVRAGFDRIVLIIRKEHKQVFEKTIGQRLKKVVAVEYVFQGMGDVPKGAKIPANRTKPFGTAHALYCCRNVVSDRFAVINADDFYGAHTLQILSDFLKQSEDGQFVSAGFKAKNTLSKSGAVKRGIFSLDGSLACGLVESLMEWRGKNVFATPLGKENWHKISPDTMVSMTCFGFSKKIMQQLEKDIKGFFAQSEDVLSSAEFLLTDEVERALDAGVTMEVVPTSSKWFGMTYRNEVDGIRKELQALKDKGVYPQHLWN